MYFFNFFPRPPALPPTPYSPHPQAWDNIRWLILMYNVWCTLFWAVIFHLRPEYLMTCPHDAHICFSFARPPFFCGQYFLGSERESIKQI